MKALCWYGKHDVRAEQVPDPTLLNPRDAIVRVTSTAICGSDLHLYNGFIPTMESGDILGHEFMGEVVELGSGVKNLQLGDRVVNPFPIVDGIENLRVDWGVDTSGDGTPDVWSRCDAASPCDAAAWANVTAVKVYILSRNIESSTGYSDDKSYVMGLSGATTATTDAFKRHVYSATITLPNRTGPREPIFAS